MRSSWNEIRLRAAAFAKEWEGESYEKGEAQTFYNDFFQIFDVKRRRVAVFEQRVEKLNNQSGYIDLFWPGVMLAEHKSLGGDLDKAYDQAGEYFDALPDNKHPRYVLTCDFRTFVLRDLSERTKDEFELKDLPKHVKKFGFIMGVQRRAFRDQDPANIRASELVGKLHDKLRASKYTGHALEQYLVRIVFCLFADDTGIFEHDIFLEYIDTRTQSNGSDVGPRISHLFQVLNTPEDRRSKNLDEDLAQFPFINGALFEESLPIAEFNPDMRESLLEVCWFDWSNISPAIFGSMFQSVMNPEERRKKAAHYTSEQNILKAIEPLFLDDLRAEFDRLKHRKDMRRRADLQKFQEKLGQLRLFDPACGCGNFLVIAYREIRQLELEVLKEMFPKGAVQLKGLDAATISKVNVDQFYGIEIEEFPVRIAEAAMWMMDHIMNNRLSDEFGETFLRIPLRVSPRIVIGNALDMSWEDVLPSSECSYVLGNPPFAGHQWRTRGQQLDMARVWGTEGQVNRLDYVTCWFNMAIKYAAANRSIEIAFVSTNSITQGEQCGILWPPILARDVSIRFAHRTFQWNSEARGKAAVHCVIIGLTFLETCKRFIFDYSHVRGDPHVSEVRKINGYLFDGTQVSVPARSKPPHGRRKMHKGSQPTDGARLRKPGGGYQTFSNLILGEDDRQELLAADPNCEKWLRPYIGGEELISGIWRWCLWLKDADPSELKASPALRERLDRVRSGRLQSPTASVRAAARYPTLFTQDRQPDTEYLAVPEVSSETREYIPIDVLPPSVIASNKLQIIPGAPSHYFGILTSAMHMAWMRAVSGRLKSDYSYSPSVYNSFPFPEMTQRQLEKIENLAKEVLSARSNFPGSSLDVLYDIDSMPPDLRRAHEALDRAVDRLYKKTGFKSERERVEHLFGLYERMRGSLDAEMRARPKRRRSQRKKT